MGIAAFCNGIENSNLLRKNLSKAQGIKNPLAPGGDEPNNDSVHAMQRKHGSVKYHQE